MRNAKEKSLADEIGSPLSNRFETGEERGKKARQFFSTLNENGEKLLTVDKQRQRVSERERERRDGP